MFSKHRTAIPAYDGSLKFAKQVLDCEHTLEVISIIKILQERTVFDKQTSRTRYRINRFFHIRMSFIFAGVQQLYKATMVNACNILLTHDKYFSRRINFIVGKSLTMSENVCTEELRCVQHKCHCADLFQQ